MRGEILVGPERRRRWSEGSEDVGLMQVNFPVAPVPGSPRESDAIQELKHSSGE